MPTNKVAKDDTLQSLVSAVEDIADLMGDGVIDDTSTAADKTWSASKENTVINGLRSEQAVLGARNFVPTPNDLKNGVESQGTTMTSRLDGSVLVDGSNVSNTDYPLTSLSNVATKTKLYLPKGTYTCALLKPNGTPVTWNDDGFTIQVRYSSNNQATNLFTAPYYGKASFTIDDTVVNNADYKDVDGKVLVGIYITNKPNSSYDNVVVYPVLCLGTDTNISFSPYAMTNRELTDKVQGIIDAATNAADFAAFKTAIAAL